MPGYTHLQQAQPIYLSHYLLSFFWALERDKSRLKHCLVSSGEMPLGSGALAGSAFRYNRKKTAADLGFKGITANSIDAVAHRDFVLEFLSTLAVLGSLLSRYTEDFVIWSSSEFGYLMLDESFATGSSMMPHKKNPDSMELIRAKAGRLLGNYCSVFTAVKGLPLTYNRDLQEDKEPVFDSVETAEVVLAVMQKALNSMAFNRKAITQKLNPELLATDLADDLTRAGMPFRDAYNLVGNLIKKAEEKGCSFLALPDKEWSKLPQGLQLKKGLNYTNSINKRNIEGGTGKTSVSKQLRLAKRILSSSSSIDS
jgi:argininosuccinate lyase